MSATEKEAAFRSTIERGGATVHLDARRAGVVVPEHLRERAVLVLHIAPHLPTMTRDLVIDADGVRCLLSFSRQPFRVVLPWSAIYAVIDAAFGIAVWPESMPDELLPGVTRPAQPTAPAPRGKPQLRLLKN